MQRGLQKIFISDVTQVLVTGKGSQANLMEVITANGTTSICNASSYKYPNSLAYASGGFSGNKMIICGGGYRFAEPINVSCYSFGRENGWKLHSIQKDNVVSSSATIPLLNGLWITGGLSYFPRNYLDATEIVLLNGTRVEGIRLPSPVFRQCAVKHKDIAILIGGIFDAFYFY